MEDDWIVDNFFPAVEAEEEIEAAEEAEQKQERG